MTVKDSAMLLFVLVVVCFSLVVAVKSATTQADTWRCVESVVVERECETIDKDGEGHLVNKKESCPREICTHILRFNKEINLQ